jgi:phosphotransferase system enzyme I (PtsI)
MSDHKPEKEVVLKGIGVSPGVVIAPAFVMATEALSVPRREIAEGEADLEVIRLEGALIETRRQLKTLQKDLMSRTAMSDGSILDAHLMVLDDKMFIEEVIREVRERRVNVEPVVREVAERYAAVLASLDDEYLRERVVDVRDVAPRIIRNLSGGVPENMTDVPHRHIVVAEDLAPSETAALRKEMVDGFATDLGSPTSHSAVMARALEIPAVVGLRDVSHRVMTGDPILMDGNRGVFIIRPTPERLAEYGKLAEERRHITQGLKSLRDAPAVTTDGHRIVLSANTESLEESPSVLEYGAEGVGLFRSEYLYLAEQKMVGEDAQAAVYTQVAARLKPAPVIIRTLDLGGDKFMTDDTFHHESNPFLGCRSIRLTLQYPDLFKVQLRAILRASAEGNVKLMYPMVSNAGEVVRANALLEEAKRELDVRGVSYKKDIEVGAMVEIPSAALTADTIAEHVKFFSLGTNDLIQYTLAVDRKNERVAYLYEPTHPAVLKLIKMTIDSGHGRGIWVGVCGEMAADPLMTPLLVGMGVDELSMAPSAVPLVKDAVRSLTMTRCAELARTALACKTATEVLGHCRKLMSEVAPELMELI